MADQPDLGAETPTSDPEIRQDSPQPTESVTPAPSPVEAPPQGQGPSKEIQGRSDHTAEGRDHQVPTAEEAQFYRTRTALVARFRQIERVLILKERLQMAFVENHWPRPYYVRWKHEANELFALAVLLTHRLKRLDQSRGRRVPR